MIVVLMHEQKRHDQMRKSEMEAYEKMVSDCYCGNACRTTPTTTTTTTLQQYKQLHKCPW